VQPAQAAIPQSLQRKSHLAGHLAMTSDDDFRIRPGRIRSRQIQHAKPFVAQALAATQRQAVMSAAKGGSALRALHASAAAVSPASRPTGC
jgi:hypothetical protein